MMKEYKVQSSWTKSIVVPTYGFSPICIAKDGGILGSNIRGRLEKINDKGELLEYLRYGRGCRELCDANLPSVMYRESLLSLPKQVKMTNSNRQEKSGVLRIGSIESRSLLRV